MEACRVKCPTDFCSACQWERRRALSFSHCACPPACWAPVLGNQAWDGTEPFTPKHPPPCPWHFASSHGPCPWHPPAPAPALPELCPCPALASLPPHPQPTPALSLPADPLLLPHTPLHSDSLALIFSAYLYSRFSIDMACLWTLITQLRTLVCTWTLAMVLILVCLWILILVLSPVCTWISIPALQLAMTNAPITRPDYQRQCLTDNPR